MRSGRNGAPGSGHVSPVAVVTGAARGIGAATVDRLVAGGWHVVAVDLCADDPSLDYSLSGPADLEALGPGTAPTCTPWWATCGADPTCNPPSLLRWRGVRWS
jgi:hypothetical protein